MSVDAATTDSRNRVFVTGAGFTRGLVPNAPLLIDDFGNDALADRVLGLPNASRLVEWERNRHPKGHIDIERLMTRVESLMPYDFAEFAGNAANEYTLLLSELKRSFLYRIREAEQGKIHKDDLAKFARYFANTQSHCITFNYDVFLDRALLATHQWSPLGGYGFHCPSSLDTVAQMGRGGRGLRHSAAQTPWFGELATEAGTRNPVPLDAITHHDDWSGIPGTSLPQVADHLEPQPVIVPPVLSKSSLWSSRSSALFGRRHSRSCNPLTRSLSWATPSPLPTWLPEHCCRKP